MLCLSVFTVLQYYSILSLPLSLAKRHFLFVFFGFVSDILDTGQLIWGSVYYIRDLVVLWGYICEHSSCKCQCKKGNAHKSDSSIYVHLGSWFFSSSAKGLRSHQMVFWRIIVYRKCDYAKICHCQPLVLSFCKRYVFMVPRYWFAQNAHWFVIFS